MEIVCYKGCGQGEEIVYIDDMKYIELLYPEFESEKLVNIGAIKKETKKYIWTFSKISLVEYFIYNIKNYSWQVIEDVFCYKKGTLRRLANTVRKGNVDRGAYKKSRDYEIIHRMSNK